MPSPIKSPVEKKSSNTTRKEIPPEKQTTRTKKTAAPALKKTPAATGITTVSASAVTVTTSKERYRLIAEAAYYIAEKRGFQGGNPEQDWFDATEQVDKVFME